MKRTQAAGANGAEPRVPTRTRLLRPSIWGEASVSTLTAEAFRIYVGLTTCADDDGWLLWRPANLGARLRPFEPVARREGVLEKVGLELVGAGLLAIETCRCAYLPCLFRDFRIAGGNHATTIADFHAAHSSPDSYVQVPIDPAPLSASSSSSDSRSLLDSSPRGVVAPSGSLPRSRPEATEDPWTGWNPAWLPVREAMARRGFLLPPWGNLNKDDSQRDRLWALVRENPKLVARLMDEAPANLRAGDGSFFDLVGNVFVAWNALAGDDGP